MFEPKPIDSVPESGPVDFVIVANQKTTRQVEWASFHDLLGGPFRSRMSGHVEVENSPPLEAQDKEHVENAIDFAVGTTAKSMARVSCR